MYCNKIGLLNSQEKRIKKSNRLCIAHSVWNISADSVFLSNFAYESKNAMLTKISIMLNILQSLTSLKKKQKIMIHHFFPDIHLTCQRFNVIDQQLTVNQASDGAHVGNFRLIRSNLVLVTNLHYLGT